MWVALSEERPQLCELLHYPPATRCQRRLRYCTLPTARCGVSCNLVVMLVASAGLAGSFRSRVVGSPPFANVLNVNLVFGRSFDNGLIPMLIHI